MWRRHVAEAPRVVDAAAIAMVLVVGVLEGVGGAASASAGTGADHAHVAWATRRLR